MIGAVNMNAAVGCGCVNSINIDFNAASCRRFGADGTVNCVQRRTFGYYCRTFSSLFYISLRGYSNFSAGCVAAQSASKCDIRVCSIVCNIYIHTGHILNSYVAGCCVRNVYAAFSGRNGAVCMIYTFCSSDIYVIFCNKIFVKYHIFCRGYGNQSVFGCQIFAQRESACF